MLDPPDETKRVLGHIWKEFVWQILLVCAEHEAGRELRDGFLSVLLPSPFGKCPVPKGVQPTEDVMTFQVGLIVSEYCCKLVGLDQCFWLQHHTKVLFASQPFEP